MKASMRNEQVNIILRGGKLIMNNNGVEVTILIRAEELCAAISGRNVKATMNIDIDT